MKRKKGFTLIELLVVIAIIALLVAILMPALGKARRLARMVQCGTQLGGIGRAIALYQNDFKDACPTIIASNSGAANAYFNNGLYIALSTTPIPSANRAIDQTTGWIDGTNWKTNSTIGGALWLLIKYEDVEPKSFLCPNAENDKEMDLSAIISVATPAGSIKSWVDMRDFISLGNLSYSYHEPYIYPLDVTSASTLALMADKNPMCDPDVSQAGNAREVGNCNTQSGQNPMPGPTANMIGQAGKSSDQGWKPIWTDDPFSGSSTKNYQHGNTKNHETQNQNVLFAGFNVSRPERPDVGIGNDNIYSHWGAANTENNIGATNKAVAYWGGNKSAAGHAQSADDSYLGN
jgi:prepilin-type N-terminal cleavage/methylation domain-containing protein